MGTAIGMAPCCCCRVATICIHTPAAPAPPPADPTSSSRREDAEPWIRINLAERDRRVQGRPFDLVRLAKAEGIELP